MKLPKPLSLMNEVEKADEIFDIIKNHNDFYWKKNNVVFNIELQELFEVRNG